MGNSSSKKLEKQTQKNAKLHGSPVPPSLCQVIGIDHLPTVVLYHMFSFFGAKSLVSILLTCKYISKAANEDSLWKALCKREHNENNMLPGASTFFESYRMPSLFVSKEKELNTNKCQVEGLVIQHGLGFAVLYSYGPGIDYKYFVENALNRVIIDEEEKLRRFARMCRKMHHPFFIDMYYLKREEEQVYVTREYVRGCQCIFDVERHLNSIVPFYGAQLVLALEHLQTWGLLGTASLYGHNRLMVAEDHYLKICWFEPEHVGAFRDCHRYSNELLYIAPEVLTEGEYQLNLFWGLGVWLYEMFTGKRPFEQDIQARTFNSILNDTPDLSQVFNRNPNAADLITKLLERSLPKRLTNIAVVKQHPFFQEISWHDILAKTHPVQFLENGDHHNTSDVSFKRGRGGGRERGDSRERGEGRGRE